MQHKNPNVRRCANKCIFCHDEAYWHNWCDDGAFCAQVVYQSRLPAHYHEGHIMKGVFNGDKSSKVRSNNATHLLKEVDRDLLVGAICAALEDGAAVMLAQTRDAGAICVTVLHGSDRAKAYASDADEMLQLISDLAESFGVNIITTRGGARRTVRKSESLNGSDPSLGIGDTI